MENFKLQQNQQEVFTRIKSEIEQMKLNPVSKEEFYNLFDRSKTLKEKGVDITKEEENEKESHKAKYNSYGVFVKTISEFRYALECLNWYSKKTIDSLVSHENAHANKMESLGVIFVGYRIITLLDKEGKGEDFFSAERGDYPKEWTGREELEAWKAIAQAPEEYESEEPLSDWDKNIINKANDGLEK